MAMCELESEEFSYINQFPVVGLCYQIKESNGRDHFYLFFTVNENFKYLTYSLSFSLTKQSKERAKTL